MNLIDILNFDYISKVFCPLNLVFCFPGTPHANSFLPRNTNKWWKISVILIFLIICEKYVKPAHCWADSLSQLHRLVSSYTELGEAGEVSWWAEAGLAHEYSYNSYTELGEAGRWAGEQKRGWLMNNAKF